MFYIFKEESRGVLQFDRLTALSEAEEQYAPTKNI